eukprot:m.19376 g.19376  ORF g.19376 m.19376 type:complete len:64 (-) comp8020_c0_seq1:400-591(-)
MIHQQHIVETNCSSSSAHGPRHGFVFDCQTSLYTCLLALTQLYHTFVKATQHIAHACVHDTVL